MFKHIRSGILCTIGALALTAAAPAEAVTLVKRSDGTAYSGTVDGTLTSATLLFSSSLRNVTCNQSTLAGSTVSNGTDVDVTGATFTYSGGACLNSDSGTTALTAIVPWANGNFTTRTLTLNGVKVKTVGASLTCYWKGAGTGGSIALALSNGAADLVATANGAQLVRDTGSSFLCPSTATMTGTYILRTTAGEALQVNR
jgi:hypothetical protein